MLSMQQLCVSPYSTTVTAYIIMTNFVTIVISTIHFSAHIIVYNNTIIIILLPSPVWAEGTVISLCACLSVCLFLTTKLL